MKGSEWRNAKKSREDISGHGKLSRFLFRPYSYRSFESIHQMNCRKLADCGILTGGDVPRKSSRKVSKCFQMF